MAAAAALLLLLRRGCSGRSPGSWTETRRGRCAGRETLYKRYDPIGGFKRSCIGGGARVTGTRRKTAFENGNSLSKWAARHSLAAPGGNPGEKRKPPHTVWTQRRMQSAAGRLPEGYHHKKASSFRVCPRRERPLPFPPQGWEGRNTPAASPPRRWAMFSRNGGGRRESFPPPPCADAALYAIIAANSVRG